MYIHYVRLSKNLYIHYVRSSSNLHVHYVRLSRNLYVHYVRLRPTYFFCPCFFCTFPLHRNYSCHGWQQTNYHFTRVTQDHNHNITATNSTSHNSRKSYKSIQLTQLTQFSATYTSQFDSRNSNRTLLTLATFPNLLNRLELAHSLLQVQTGHGFEERYQDIC